MKKTKQTKPKTSRRPKSARKAGVEGTARTMRVSHTERIDSVGVAANFTLESYPINPGMSKTFPWLSQIAAAYEFYKFRDLKFTIVSTVPSTTDGTIAMAVDFDADDAAPFDLPKLCMMGDHAVGSPWKPLRLKPRLAEGDKLPQKYIRRAGSSYTELNDFDIGTLHVAAEGFSSTRRVSVLEVTYVVDLYVPQVEDTGGYTASDGYNTTSTTYPLGVATGLPESTGGSVRKVTQLVGGNPADVMEIPPGRYVVDMAVEGAQSTGNPVTLTQFLVADGTETTLDMVSSVPGHVEVLDHLHTSIQSSGGICEARTILLCNVIKRAHILCRPTIVVPTPVDAITTIVNIVPTTISKFHY